MFNYCRFLMFMCNNYYCYYYCDSRKIYGPYQNNEEFKQISSFQDGCSVALWAQNRGPNGNLTLELPQRGGEAWRPKTNDKQTKNQKLNTLFPNLFQASKI